MRYAEELITTMSLTPMICHDRGTRQCIRVWQELYQTSLSYRRGWL